jgi:KipI family sensor histidine kinase inhibitor
VEFRAYGDRGTLIDKLSDGERARFIATFDRSLPPGCAEIVPGSTTILCLGVAPRALASWMGDQLDGESLPDESSGRTHRIPVVYDGPDLAAVARAAKMSEEAVITAHSEASYVVRVMGFSPGFAYLEGLPERLQLPRRANPRTRIRPGSVAIGGPHAGIYPVESPGGWHILGGTAVCLFNRDAARAAGAAPDEVFLLAPGDRVVFEREAAQ